jgi:hypothetical protein
MGAIFADYPANLQSRWTVTALTVLCVSVCLMAAAQMSSETRVRAMNGWIAGAVAVVLLGFVGLYVVKVLDLP